MGVVETVIVQGARAVRSLNASSLRTAAIHPLAGKRTRRRGQLKDLAGSPDRVASPWA